MLLVGACTAGNAAEAPEGWVVYNADGYAFAHPDDWEVRTGEDLDHPEGDVEVRDVQPPRTMMHHSCAIRVIAIGAALSLVGACGAGVDNRAADLTSEEQVELVEEFAGVTLPGSTADLEVAQWVGLDEAVAAPVLARP